MVVYIVFTYLKNLKEKIKRKDEYFLGGSLFI